MREVTIRKATDADGNLPWMDFTKASALNVCPTWGLVRYVKGRTPSAEGRNLAIEAGQACHDVFAAARYASLFEGGAADFCLAKCEEHFGSDRFAQMYAAWRTGERGHDARSRFAIEALHTSGYYDDPRDKRRTLQNLEDACRAYLQHYNYKAWHPVVYKDSGLIGIETPFNLVVEYDDGKFRFVGKIDAIISNQDFGEIEIHENKTGARINEAWAMSFHMSHQVTGYIQAGRFIVPEGEDINSCVVHGLQIPLPRNVEIGGIVAERVTRTDEKFERWLKWLIDAYELAEAYKDKVFSAPQYTHSCNRYFTPCQLLPFCASSREEQEAMFYEEFREEMWYPLAKEAD